MKKIIFSLLLSFYIIITHSQSNNRYEQVFQVSKIAKREQETTQNLNMNIENTQSYHFELRRSANKIPELQNQQTLSVDSKQADFIINGIERQDIKMIVNVFWKIDGAYTLSEVKRNEQVKLTVYANKSHIINERTFYTTEGIQIHTESSTQYFIRFSSSGIKSKLLQLTLQKIIPQTTVQKSDFETFQWIEGKTVKILSSFNLILRILQRNRIFSDKNNQTILNLSKSYMGYQILQAFILIGIAVYQVKLIRKLTLNKSIV